MDGYAMHSKKKLSCCCDSRTLRQVIVTRIIPITFDTVKLGYRHASLLSFDSMCDNADELLFFKIVNVGGGSHCIVLRRNSIGLTVFSSADVHHHNCGVL